MSEDRSVGLVGGRCLHVDRDAEVGDLHGQLGGTGRGAEGTGVDHEVHLHDPVVVVDPHVGRYLAQLRQLVTLARGRVGQLGGDLGVVDRRAVVRGVLARDRVVADLGHVTGESLEVLETLLGPGRLRLVGEATEVGAAALLQLVEARLHPRLAPSSDANREVAEVHVDGAVDDPLLDRTERRTARA